MLILASAIHQQIPNDHDYLRAREFLMHPPQATSLRALTEAENRRRPPRGRAGSHRGTYQSRSNFTSSGPRLPPISPHMQINRNASFNSYPHRRAAPPAVPRDTTPFYMAAPGSRNPPNMEGVSPAIAMGSGSSNANQQTPASPAESQAVPSTVIANNPLTSSTRPSFQRHINYPTFGSMEIDNPPYYDGASHESL